jgi:hypothetical protein
LFRRDLRSLGRTGGTQGHGALFAPGLQRSTERTLTRSSFAITLFFSPWSNLWVASIRIRSRAAWSLGSSPPPCAYRISRAYPKDQHSSPRTTTQRKTQVVDGAQYRRGMGWPKPGFGGQVQSAGISVVTDADDA